MVLLAGIVWGLDEDRILTATIVKNDGSPQDDFHIHLDDEKNAFTSLNSFLGSLRIKQIILEDLSSLEGVKSRLDGPLSIQSSAWKRKMKACAKLQPRLRELGIKIKVVNSTVENYTHCFNCGDPLTHDHVHSILHPTRASP